MKYKYTPLYKFLARCCILFKIEIPATNYISSEQIVNMTGWSCQNTFCLSNCVHLIIRYTPHVDIGSVLFKGKSIITQEPNLSLSGKGVRFPLSTNNSSLEHSPRLEPVKEGTVLTRLTVTGQASYESSRQVLVFDSHKKQFKRTCYREMYWRENIRKMEGQGKQDETKYECTFREIETI